MSIGKNNIIKNVDWQLFRKFARYFKPHKKWFFPKSCFHSCHNRGWYSIPLAD